MNGSFDDTIAGGAGSGTGTGTGSGAGGKGRGPAAPFFDGLARLIAEGAGAADGVRREAETVIHSQIHRFIADMDLVPREEFEAVKEMATKALEEAERLRAEVEALRDAPSSPQSVAD